MDNGYKFFLYFSIFEFMNTLTEEILLQNYQDAH